MIKFSYPESATPIDDITSLKLSWVKTQDDLNEVEAENIANALDKYLLQSIPSPLTWFNVSTLNKIHHDMFCDVWQWAGKFRTTQTLPGISPHQIAETFESLCRDVCFWNTEECEMPRIEQAATIHHRLVWIHPYSNGNGRFSRLIADRYLKSWKLPFPKWPISLGNDGASRKRYISALKAADRGDITPLVAFMMIHL